MVLYTSCAQKHLPQETLHVYITCRTALRDKRSTMSESNRHVSSPHSHTRTHGTRHHQDPINWDCTQAVHRSIYHKKTDKCISLAGPCYAINEAPRLKATVTFHHHNPTQERTASGTTRTPLVGIAHKLCIEASATRNRTCVYHLQDHVTR